MKRIIVLLLSLTLLCLLAGCAEGSSEAEVYTGIPFHTPKPVETTPATQSAGAPTEQPTVPSTGVEPPPATTEEPPVPSSEVTPSPVAAAGDPYFSPVGTGMENYIFTNHAVEIRYDGKNVYRRDLSTGDEETLFPLETASDISCYLIGVTNERLYFGWNEEEDWWGRSVYSVDYQGKDREELGSFWDPYFGEGWLILLGFRSDVSPTEMLLIDRNDNVVFDEQSSAPVWDAVAIDESVYYVYIENAPDASNIMDVFDHEGWVLDLIRQDPDGSQTVLKSFEVTDYFTPAFINDGVLGFYELGEFYDLFTLEPVANPYG